MRRGYNRLRQASIGWVNEQKEFLTLILVFFACKDAVDLENVVAFVRTVDPSADVPNFTAA